jgi:hypothetical protein
MTGTNDQEPSRNAPGDALLMLTIPPELEDDVVDWLLAHPETTGFTSLAAYGHGGAHHLLSIAEQVAGKQPRVQFQIALSQSLAAQMLQAFEHEFGTHGCHAWAIPLLLSTGSRP